MKVKYNQLPEDLEGFHFMANKHNGSIVVWNAQEFWPKQELSTIRRAWTREKIADVVNELLARGAKFVE